MDRGILMPLIGPHGKKDYATAIEKFEKNCEKSIIETLGRLDIKAITKTDRFSLPYNKEIKVCLNGESYLNGPYEFFRVARRIVKDLLNDNVFKLRFYIYIEVDTEAGPFRMGKVCYYFRYHIKQV